MDAIKALKVVELKQKLEALGLPTNGLKSDLIQRLLESSKDESAKDGEVKSTRSKRVSNSSVQNIQDEVVSNTPTKRNRRLSNTSVLSIQEEANPDTPSRRGRRLSSAVASVKDEAKVETPTKKNLLQVDTAVETPTKRSRRLSNVSASVPEETKVDTPIKKSRRLSNVSASIPEESQVEAKVDTPVKKSRRLSNVSASVPEEGQVEVDTPVKKSRRLSNVGAQEEIKAENPSKGSERRDSKDEEVSTPIKRGRRPSNSSLLKERADTPIKMEEQKCASIKKTRRSVGLNKIDEEDSVKKGAGRVDQLIAEEISLTPRRRSRRLSNSSVTEEEAVDSAAANKMVLDKIDEAAEENEERSVPIKKRRVIEPISDLFSDDCMDTLPEDTDSLDTNAFTKTAEVELETKEHLNVKTANDIAPNKSINAVAPKEVAERSENVSSNSDETEEKGDDTILSNNTPLNTESSVTVTKSVETSAEKGVISPAISVDLDSDVDVTSKQDSELDEHLLDTTEESSVDADDAIKSNVTTASNGGIDLVTHVKSNETNEGVKMGEEKLAENLLDTTEDSNCDIEPSNETVSVDEASLKKSIEKLESTYENEVSTFEEKDLKCDIETSEEKGYVDEDLLKKNTELESSAKNEVTSSEVGDISKKDTENSNDGTGHLNCDMELSEEKISVDEAFMKKTSEELKSSAKNELISEKEGELCKKDAKKVNDCTIEDLNCDIELSAETGSIDKVSPKKNTLSPVTKDSNKDKVESKESHTHEDTAVKQVEAISLKDVSIETEVIPEPSKEACNQTNGIAGVECKVSTMDTTEMTTQKSDFEKSELWLGQSMENYFSHTTIAKQKTNMLVKADIIPRQKPKSGKFWKAERKQFNHVKKDKGPRLTFEQRLQRKEEQAKSKEIAELIINRKKQKKQELREKIEANKKKKEENERKAEIYQVINNPNKIKRMKKKQLRMVAKRDTLDMKSSSNAAA